MTETLSAWLILVNTPRLGGNRLSKLLSHGSANNLVARSRDELMALGLKADQADAIKHPDGRLLDRCLSWAAVPGQTILTLDHPAYPHLLREIPSPPPVLFVRGDIETLSLPQIAIVGSRHASMEGMRHAGEFAAGFVAADYAVTSGLALGIDGKAHAGALDAGGCTIAVLGSGLDSLYPARHKGWLYVSSKTVP